MSLPPLCMRADDPAAADPARRRLLHKSRFPHFLSAPFPPSLTSLVSLPVLSEPVHPTATHDDIHIDDSHLLDFPDGGDLYRWAVLYENQRGITLFSTPFYSALSLLPFDPQPFTFPRPYSFRANNPNLSLHNYPLPDGTWRWVSAAWMIDMRSDLGEVQHDGFEYNWSFRDNHWHANAGKLGTGAWVRRRRWVRLMMRPANRASTNMSTNCDLSILPALHPTSNLSLPELDHHAFHLWDGSEHDWKYVHRLLRQLGRDGRKLELWRMWLAPYAQTHTADFRGKGKQFDLPSPPSQKTLENRLSDILPEGNPPPLVYLGTILRNHGEAILHSFVFPDSRAQFFHLVRLAGRSQDLESGIGHGFSAADVDFWSYADTLCNSSD